MHGDPGHTHTFSPSRQLHSLAGGEGGDRGGGDVEGGVCGDGGGDVEGGVCGDGGGGVCRWKRQVTYCRMTDNLTKSKQPNSEDTTKQREGPK